MLKERKVVFERIFRINDIIIIIFSMVMAYFYRFSTLDFYSLLRRKEYAVFCISYLIFWVFFSGKFRLYDSKRLVRFSSESLDVAKNILFCFFAAMIPAFFFREYPLSRMFLGYMLALQIGTLLVFRFVLRFLLKYIRRKGYNFRHVLIIGKNGRSERIAEKISNTPEYGINILGYLDVRGKNGLKYLQNIELLGDLSKLEHVLRNNVVDLVIVTLPLRSCYNEIENILLICETTGVEVEIPLELFNPKISKISLSKFEEIDFLNFYTGAYQVHWRHLIKRILDLTLALTLSVLLIPVFILTMILIKKDSQGPSIFKQKRVGLNGRLFNLYKFRTMVQNAESMKRQLEAQNELDGPVFKIKKDPRITKIGTFLRKTSIDELPQLLNVLKGDMSLVGPRPPLPDEVYKYRLGDRRRLSVRPGITGLWQVSGRNNIPFERWMDLDREYIDKWSLFLDMKILIKTVSVVFSTKNAF